MNADREAWSLDGLLWPTFGGEPQRMQALQSRLGDGVLLGVTRTGRPAVTRLLQPAPVRIAVVGGAWIASLLMLRAAALGAAAVVVTERPTSWEPMIRRVGGAVPFAHVVTPHAALPVATVANPIFVLHDGSASGAEAAVARAPWNTSVHLVYRLTPQAMSLLDAAELVLLPRPSDEDLARTLELLRLPARMSAQVERMEGSDVLAITNTRAAVISVQATTTEAAILQSA